MNVRSLSPLADRIKELTGIDVTGFIHGIQKDGIKYIKIRHGEHGEADSSMANAEDVARMQFILDNYVYVMDVLNMPPGSG